MNKEYKKETYKDAGVEKSFTTKALISVLALLLAFALTLSSCGSAADNGSSAVTTTAASLDNAVSKSEMFTERDLSDDYDESEAETITLSGNSAKTSAASGVSIDGSTITISAEGVYVVSGSLSDGQIIVDANDAAKVQIVLKDASVTSSDSAALYVKSADKVFVTTAAGTENTLANGGSFTADGDTNVDGAVYAKDDITFNGSGSLTISSPAGHGVVGNDDVKFGGGTYVITASGHGVKANDSARFAESDVTITAGSDKDGVHVADSDVEDAAQSESFFYMADGSLTINAQDDGIHADAKVIIEGGSIIINESYEGIEGLAISISGGSTTVVATDDGLNAAGGNSTSGNGAFGGDDWNGGGMMNDGGTDGSIVISGGNVSITAGGDGVDSNGSVEITGGYTVVQGPSSGDTSVLDYNGTATISGGTFIGTGGAGMAENFSSASQGLIAVSTGNQSAGSSVTLKDAAGNVIAEATPALDYAVVYISTEDMAQGETYTLTAGTYSENITLSDIMYSTLSGGMGGSFGGGGPRGGMNEGGMHDGGKDGMNGDMFQGGPGQGPGTDGVTGATQLKGDEAA
ncbi:MAG: carbohydrate-binding domain-containing protein [Mogibacterium sp.]|nr:carbohydrate-binding domain-containing protein [Mogibacterium sp.]